MAIFTYLIVAAIGVFAQKVRGRNGLAWGLVTLAIISLGNLYIQLAGGSELAWTAMVSIASALLLAGLQPGKNSTPTSIECPFCAEKINPKAKICKHCGKDLPAITAIAQAETISPTTNVIKPKQEESQPHKANPLISWLKKNTNDFIALTILALIVAGANGKLRNIFNTESEAPIQHTTHILSATSASDGMFNQDIDISDKKDSDIKTFTSIGMMMIGQNRLRDSESAYFIAANIAERLHGPNSIEYAKAIDQLAFMYFGLCAQAYTIKNNNWSSQEKNACEAAGQHFVRVISIYEKTTGKNSIEANTTRDVYASTLEFLDRKTEATQVRNQITTNTR
jgi:hypothetical protein